MMSGSSWVSDMRDWDMRESVVLVAPLHTYKLHIIVVTLVRLEKVCHPSLQTATDEDAFVDVK